MNITEDLNNQKHDKLRSCCRRVTLLPIEYEFTCIACGYNVIEQKNQLSKDSLENLNIINKTNYAEHKIFCFFLIYKKFIKVMIPIKSMKFYQN